MEVVDTKLCGNCKREIPTVNFTTHSVHCARNIGVCPVCKEPLPHSELKEHHEKLHKLLPCKKCGESVCGTDLEDHIRDSCAHTIKTCRFCELELPRRDLPAHENYCGVRTEQCPDCREWVMIKYRQLHLDSNHGFLRLDDDPAPIPKKEPPKINASKPLITKMTNTNLPSTSNGSARPSTSNIDRPNATSNINRPNATSNINRPNATSNINRPNATSNINRPNTTSNINSRPNGLNNINLINKPTTEMRYFSSGSSSLVSSSSGSSNGDGHSSDWQQRSSPTNGAKVPVKRTNDQPQINTNVAAPNKVEKNLCISRGAVKKRMAPKPPPRSPPPSPHRDMPYYSALQRQQKEEKERREQTAYNLSVGLPPVLSPAAKLDKLRKMDALQNPETSVDYKSRLQGRTKKSPEYQPGYVLGSSSDDPERRRQEFKNLKPMTPQEFMERFNELQLRKDEGDGSPNGGDAEGRRKCGDRFSEIKSSLRELRRGLNEVTAPYHSNPIISANVINNNNGEEHGVRSGRASPANDDVRLPCEFCNTLIPAHNLVQHQTGCRPDLAQLLARSPEQAGVAGEAVAAALAPRPRPGPPPREPEPEPCDEPVIPCEFCTESLPVYLISEHQERCGREANLLYPD